jgi:hypothetical protein
MKNIKLPAYGKGPTGLIAGISNPGRAPLIPLFKKSNFVRFLLGYQSGNLARCTVSKRLVNALPDLFLTGVQP